MGKKSNLRVLEDTLSVLKTLGPVLQTVRRHSKKHAEQLESSASSIALNLSEGNATRDGRRRARFLDALGSCQETRTNLRIAAAWGWLSEAMVEDLDARLDSIAARTYRLAHR